MEGVEACDLMLVWTDGRGQAQTYYFLSGKLLAFKNSNSETVWAMLEFL